MPSIRVSGFTEPRARGPLVDPNGNPIPGALGASTLYNALVDSNNFGPAGIVPCPIEFLPFVTEILPNSLVNSNGNLLVDVFFGALNETTLSPGEAAELAAFVNAGGILYISGNSSGEGLSYNPLFTALGITDQFSAATVGSSGQTSVPLPTPVTTGPFGIIGPLSDTPFSPIITGTGLTGVATDSGQVLLAEGAFSTGYLSATGDPSYFNLFTDVDPDNLNYFLNLFALACRAAAPTRGIDISKSSIISSFTD